MNNLVSTLELSHDFNECYIAIRKIWNRFHGINFSSVSAEDIEEYKKFYPALLVCGERFCSYTPQPIQEKQYHELVIYFLHLIHLAESPSIPMYLSSNHFPVISRLITLADNAFIMNDFFKELITYLNSPYLHTLAFNRLLSLAAEQVHQNNNSILEVLCEIQQLKSLQASQIVQLRNLLLSFIPPTMLFASPPIPLVQMLTKVEAFLETLKEAQ